MLNEEYPKTRAEAKQLGVNKYFTGKPCINGHIDLRYASGCECMGCTLHYNIRNKESRYASIREKPKRAWSSSAVKGAKKRATDKGVPFDISIDYVESILPTKCPVFGTQFAYAGNKKVVPESPSIDRIDPAKGYVEGNIAIISAKANQIKSAYKSQDIYKVAAWLESIGH